MFRIVEDKMPPLPESCSTLLEDFLKQCFNKEPTLRPSADILFEHPWLKQNWGAHKVLHTSRHRLCLAHVASLGIASARQYSLPSPCQHRLTEVGSGAAALPSRDAGQVIGQVHQDGGAC